MDSVIVFKTDKIIEGGAHKTIHAFPDLDNYPTNLIGGKLDVQVKNDWPLSDFFNQVEHFRIRFEPMPEDNFSGYQGLQSARFECVRRVVKIDSIKVYLGSMIKGRDVFTSPQFINDPHWKETKPWEDQYITLKPGKKLTMNDEETELYRIKMILVMRPYSEWNKWFHHVYLDRIGHFESVLNKHAKAKS